VTDYPGPPAGPPRPPLLAAVVHELPIVPATAYPPLPDSVQTDLIAEHVICGRHHRHVTRSLVDDSLIRWPPCGLGGPYRLSVRIARPPSTRGRDGAL
jgi:hypothetical protein